MSKSLSARLNLSTDFLATSFLATAFLAAGFLTGCATLDKVGEAAELSEAQYASDHCKFLGGLFKDQSLNNSLAVIDFNGGGGGISGPEKSEDQLSWPWDNSNEAKISRDRAALRKAHKQKGCTK